MNEEVAKIYGNKVRVRASGICWEKDRLLLVNHKGITSTNFWAPPGGGVEFSWSVEESLKKEFSEETGLLVKPGKFLFCCELIKKPFHALELFFDVRVIDGDLKTGSDPELQIIEEARFMSVEEILIIPKDQLHGIFQIISDPVDLKNLTGFFRI